MLWCLVPRCFVCLSLGAQSGRGPRDCSCVSGPPEAMLRWGSAGTSMLAPWRIVHPKARPLAAPVAMDVEVGSALVCRQGRRSEV